MKKILFFTVLVFLCSCTEQKKDLRQAPKQHKLIGDARFEKLLSCPNRHHPHLIDLGLPSGTLWACCNVFAEKPTDNGGYLSWGETTEKEVYNDVTYLYCEGDAPNDNGWYDDNIQWIDIGTNISGTKFDVAHVKWGNKWQMPTSDQFQEVIDNCTLEWIKVNNCEGQLFISKSNGNTLYFPAAGCRLEDAPPDNNGAKGSWGGYWSGTRHPIDKYYAYHLYIYNNHAEVDLDNMWGLVMGFPIRPVAVP